MSDSDREPLRVGIAGFGLAGQVFHAPLIEATPGLEVRAIVTGDPGRSAKAKERYPDVVVASSVEEILGHIDLLVVATPNRTHAELALLGIDAGLHVVVDKPLAPNREQAEGLVAARGNLTVFQNRRWDGDFLTVRSLIDDGVLGEVIRFESRFERFRPDVGEGWRESGDPDEGGGQLADLGAHLIDQAIILFGPPVRLYAEVDRRRTGVEADDDVFVALEHAGGVRSHLHMGKLAPLAGPRFKVIGLGGGLAIDGLDPQESQLADGLQPGSPKYGMRDAGRIVTPGAGEGPVTLKPGAYGEFYEGVERWVGGFSPPPVDPEDSLLVMKVIEAARTSSRRNEVLQFP